MAFLLEPRNRIVIPRWREFERGSHNSEIITLKTQGRSSFEIGEVLGGKIRDWDNKRNISNALELVNSAYSLGSLAVANDAAKFLISTGRKFPMSFENIINEIIGKRLDGKVQILTQFDFKNFFRTSGSQIHDLRLKLKENPNNPLLWTILARNYAILGNIEKAKKAITTALTLTRYSNTYVQRIASRFYYHLDEVDRALYIIRQSKNYSVDPWLISSDIAYSTKLGRHNKNLSIGMKMIESNKFSGRDLTELASSLGTVQMFSGSLKQAMKSFNTSLIDPNENSFAQIAFISSEVKPIFQNKELQNQLHLLPNAYEAQAHEFQSVGSFQEAFNAGCQWLIDQPFSKRAAIFSQYLAISKLEQFDKGIEIGEFALHANSQSFEINNNLAFAHAKKYEIEKANYYLDRMSVLLPNDVHRIILLATSGLVRIRSGNLVEGKKMYADSIELATNLKQPILKELAIYNYLKEVWLASGEIDNVYISQLDKKSQFRKELELLLRVS